MEAMRRALVEILRKISPPPSLPLAREESQKFIKSVLID
jgi:hypothetical protein